MDKMEPKAKPAPKKPKEETFHVSDTLKGSTAAQLTKLKENLTEKEEEKKPAQSAKTKSKEKRPNRSAKERLEENPDLSFAELFNPADDEESSFEDMLSESKLDWRFFKDE